MNCSMIYNMPKTMLTKSLAWTSALTTLFVLAIGAVLISLVVGDWIALKTGNFVIAWVIGIFIMLGFLVTLGAGVGIWLWLRTPIAPSQKEDLHQSMDKILVAGRSKDYSED